MRQRIEDLGRLAVMLRNVLEQDLFSDNFHIKPLRPKDATEWFLAKTEEEKLEIISNWAYSIEAIEHKIYDMLDIAEGTDLLNEDK